MNRAIPFAAIALCAVALSTATTVTSAQSDPDRSEVAPSEYVYPGATIRNATAVGSGKAFVYSAIMATSDTLPQVVDFYSRRTGLALAADNVGATTQHIRQPAGDWYLMHDDSLMALSDEPRQVSLRYFISHTPNQQITLVISRTPADKHTHIILTHVGTNSE